MELDPVELGARERTGLVPDRVRHAGRAELVHERRPTDHHDLVLRAPEVRRGVGGELCAPPAVPRAERRLEVDEVRRHGERLVQFGPIQDAVRFRFEVPHRVPRLQLRDLLEPDVPVRGEQVREFGVVGAPATTASGVDGGGR